MTGELILELAAIDDVAVSKESDHILVSSTGHDGEDTIELEAVHDRIETAGHRVRATRTTIGGDGDAELQLEVVARGE